MVKEKEGRNRYVAFAVEGEGSFEMEDMLKALRDVSVPSPLLWLASFDGRRGIVRCKHTSKDETIRVLESICNIGVSPVKVRTLGTSGTIRRAKRKFLRRNMLGLV